jgi:HPt (histidine-containing phosphotransfer) domain-containing protein
MFITFILSLFFFYLLAGEFQEKIQHMTIKTSPEEQRAIHKLASLEPALKRTQAELDEELEKLDAGQPYESIINDEWLDNLEHLVNDLQRTAHAIADRYQEKSRPSDEG